MWQDMERDARSLRNTYRVDVDDAGVAMTGVKAKGRPQGMCRFYNYPSSCRKGDNCPYLHVDPNRQQGVSGNLTKVTVFDEDQADLLPAVGAVVTVEVSCITSPSHFYVTLPWGPFSIQEVTSETQGVKGYVSGETLTSLNASMQEFYKNKRLDTDYSLYAPGQAVAALSEKSGSWLRAKVIDIEPDEEAVLVMYVDFGDMEWVKERNLRQLDLQFLPLPPQAVECSLLGVLPPPPHTTWPQQSSLEFFKLVDGKSLVAHVKERLWSGRLMVELYDTSQVTEDINLKMLLIQRGLAVAVAVADPGEGSNRPSHSTPQDADGQEIAQDGDVTYVPG
ncbi:tudor and KH domain-containing protein homolog [Babylonia areolata]|uniref:tudor and KH domain-containing protein homolog n=1 Tax=Babylonia areolata TaxID=304850 RepID=UPI003FD18FE1